MFPINFENKEQKKTWYWAPKKTPKYSKARERRLTEADIHFLFIFRGKAPLI